MFNFLKNFTPEQKKRLVVIVVLLILLYPAYRLVKMSTEMRKKASQPVSIDTKESAIKLEKVEVASASLSGIDSSNVTVSLDGGSLKVEFMKGTLDSKIASTEKIVFASFPVVENDKLLRFSLNLEKETVLEGNISTPSPTLSVISPTASVTNVFQNPTATPSLALSPTEFITRSPVKPTIIDDSVLGIGSDKPPFKENISNSEKYYTISYALSALKGEYAPSTFKFVWLNPENGAWEEIPTVIDNEKGIAYAKLNHFSEGGAKAEKAQVFSPTLKSWETDLYTGSVSHAFPIEVVPGVGGLSPNLAISYNSNRANFLFDEQKGSWLGAGWDLTTPEIRFDSYEKSEWGDCRQSAGSRKEGPQYSLILDGIGGPLVWIGDEGNAGRFVTKGNARIMGYYGNYRGNTTFGNACDLRKKIVVKWIVIGTNGIEYTFDIPESEVGTSPNAANRMVENVMVPTRYMITKIKDVSGNIINFEYQIPDRDKNGDQFLSTYPFAIRYNGGKSAVSFELGEKVNAPQKPGNQDKNIERSRLQKIYVFSDTAGRGKLYRTYTLNFDTNSGFDTLRKIEVNGPGTSEPKNKFVSTEFLYEPKPVGLEYEVLGKEFVGGCSGQEEYHAVGSTTWEGLVGVINGEPGQGSPVPEAQRQKLIKAGWLNCSKGPGKDGCPESAENEPYYIEAYWGERVTPTPQADYLICRTKVEVGSILSWEKNKAPFLTKVKNGYGGEITFTYQNMHRQKYGLNKNVVVNRTISDPNFREKGSPDVSVAYQYHSILEDGSGRMLNKGGGFGRVTQVDPVTQVLTTTFFYPLAPSEGDGNVDPDKNPFFGVPFRTVVHKLEGNSERIYSDQFMSYSFIPPYDPNFGLSDSDLLRDTNRSSWYGTRLIDNLMLEGIGKRVSTVSDSFIPKTSSYVTIAQIDSKKPQYVDNNERKTLFLHTQSKTIYDRYGYPVKSVQLGDVNDNANGFNISSEKADLSKGRHAVSDANFWWNDSDLFTFGLPSTPVLFADTVIKRQDTCMPDGWYKNNEGSCDESVEPHVEWLDVCCTGSRTKTDNKCGDHGGGLCVNRVEVAGSLITCNRFSSSQCFNLLSRNPIITTAPSSGSAGTLKRFSYNKYLRDPAYLSLNMTGLVAESFGSDVDVASFDGVGQGDRWGWTINSYDGDGKKRGFISSVEKKNTFTQREGVNSPDSIVTRVEYNDVGNIIASIDALGNRSTTIYSNSGKPYDNILPVETRQTISKEDGTNIVVASRTFYKDDFWLPEIVTDANGTQTKTSYDCLGRVQEIFKPDSTTVGRISSLPSVTNLYFDYNANDCGLGAVNSNNPLPHLRIKTRLSSSVSDQMYSYNDQISDGMGQTRQTIVLKTKIGGVDRGIVSEVRFDNRGLKIAESLPIDRDPINLIYDTTPQPAYISGLNFTGQSTSYLYDELGRVLETTDPIGQKTRTEYFGLKTVSTDQNNYVKTSNKSQTVTEVDGLGRTVYTKVTNLPDSTSPTYGLVTYPTYDILGNVILATQKKCNVPLCNGAETVLSTVTTDFDRLGRKWRVTDPDLGTWKYAYDENGNLLKQVDNKGQEISFVYDNLNRLIKKLYTGNARAGLSTVRNFIKYVYDKDADPDGKTYTNPAQQTGTLIGKRIRVWDVTGNTRFFYDLRGRLIKDSKTVNKMLFGQSGAEISDTSYEYFDSDSLKATLLPTGERVEQRLNEFGQLTGVRSNLGEYLKDQQYNKFGSPTRGILGNNLESTRRYDGLGRLARICVAQNCDSQTGELMDYRYESRDKVGNILNIRDDVAGSNYNLSYTYDNLYQLKNATGQPYTASYDYDPEGSMLRKQEGTETISMNYTDPKHKHAPKIVNGFTYVYDDNGNLVEDEERCMVWDFDNKPVKIIMKQTKREVGCTQYFSGTKQGVTTEYAYDGDGNRVLKRAITP